jgi:hypothetical protein
MTTAEVIVVLILIAPALTIKTSKEQDIQAFYAWLVKNDVNFPVRITSNPGVGYRFALTESFSKDKPIMSFGQRLLITPRKARRSRLGKVILSIEATSGFQLSDIEILALYLVYEHARPNSFWAPFFKVCAVVVLLVVPGFLA